MLKNKNKIISLVTAVTSMVSLMPISAYASTRVTVGPKTGKVSKAVAYDGGKYFVEANNINNFKDNSTYYYNGSIYNKTDSLNNSSDIDSYGNYVESPDKSINLSNGAIEDGNKSKSDSSSASTHLRTNILKDNKTRYKNGNSINLEDDGKTIHMYAPDEYVNDFLKVPSPSYYGNTWYQTQYNAINPNDNAASWYHLDSIFTDKDGKYVLADYSVGDLKLLIADSKSTTSSAVTYNPIDSKNTTPAAVTYNTIKFKNTTDEVDGYKANIMHAGTFTSDDNYIYRLGTLYISDGLLSYMTENVRFGTEENPITIKTDSGAWLTRESAGEGFSMFLAKNLVDDNNDDKAPVFAIPMIQKISKKQAKDTANGLKYPSTVENYILADANGNLEYNTYILTSKYTISNGKLVAYSYDNDSKKLVVTKINLIKKSNYSYTDLEEAVSQDITSENSYTIDSQGNLYVLNNGQIMKFDTDSNSFVPVYTVNSTYDRLSVYDSDDMIAWNSESNSYSVIALTKSSGHRSSKKSRSSSDETNSSSDDNSDISRTSNINKDNSINTAAPKWKVANGKWYLINEDGSYYTGWYKYKNDSNWYYLNADGSMATGWVQCNTNNWYYLIPNGSMATGWVADNSGNWYYLNTNGTMVTGWIQDPLTGKWYYLYSNGSMAHDTYVNGYYLDSNGAWV
ncbi:hypothetical protein [Clostridium saccharobutylicum]|uniref:Autolysin n=1 Tax=Clostridium saccharobutylicum TaxID=169679 RepID=A0A1S8NDP6_CLOSA|nr:autolysin [Clostridium saccharobutylicum]